MFSSPPAPFSDDRSVETIRPSKPREMAVSCVKVSSCVIVCAVSFLVVIKSCSAGCGIDGGFQCSARTKREVDGDKPKPFNTYIIVLDRVSPLGWGLSVNKLTVSSELHLFKTGYNPTRADLVANTIARIRTKMIRMLVMSLPLFLAQQLNEAETFEEMLNILDPDTVAPPVIAEEVISRKSASPLSSVRSALSSFFGRKSSTQGTESPPEPSTSPTPAAISARFGGRNEVVIEPRGSKPQTAKPAKCQPMLMSVPVKQPDDPNLFYLPECVYLEQCGGCCNIGLYQCEPKEKETVTVPVAVMTVGRVTGRKNTTLITMEKHLKCRCDCKTKPHHCNSFQRHEACECVCTNTDERTKCLSNPKKEWDKDRCSCSCKENEDCTTGLEFDPITCTCIRRPQPISTRVGGRPDTTYEVRSDDRRRRRWGNTTRYTVVP